MKKIVFVRPNMGDFRSADAMTPLVFGILAALTPPSIKTVLYDERLQPIPIDTDADLVAITVETFTARRAYQIADAYRRVGVPVILGGYHPTLLPEEAQQHADAIVLGDAETLWPAILQDVANSQLKPRYKNSGDANLLPLQVDRHIYIGKKYVPMSLVQYGRGCRFACDFCSIHAFYGEQITQRTMDSLLEELRQLPTSRPVFFVDDNLFSRREIFERFLEAITPLKLRWTCQISLDVARDERLLDKMAKAGCMMALIGFESLSRANLRQMGKPWNRVAGDYTQVVRRFYQRGIMIYGTFVFGYEHDTLDSFDAVADFALEAGLSIANFNPLTPTPGTALYDRMRDEQRLIYDRWWLDETYRYGKAIFRPYGMSPEQLEEGIQRTRERFYSHRSIATRLLGRRELIFKPYNLGVMLLANWISRREIFNKRHQPLGVQLQGASRA